MTAVEKKLFQLIKIDVDDNGITMKEIDVFGLKNLLKQRLSPRSFDISCTNEDGCTPLMIVAEEIDHSHSMSLSAAEELCSYEIMSLLFDHGSNVNIQNTVETEYSQGMTALNYACFSSSSNIVKLLLKYETNPHLPNDDNTTPLFSLSCSADTDKMKALLECGADANYKDSNGSAYPFMRYYLLDVYMVVLCKMLFVVANYYYNMELTLMIRIWMA